MKKCINCGNVFEKEQDKCPECGFPASMCDDVDSVASTQLPPHLHRVSPQGSQPYQQQSQSRDTTLNPPYNNIPDKNNTFNPYQNKNSARQEAGESNTSYIILALLSPVIISIILIVVLVLLVSIFN